jgi:hypothetical protein
MALALAICIAQVGAWGRGSSCLHSTLSCKCLLLVSLNFELMVAALFVCVAHLPRRASWA